MFNNLKNSLSSLGDITAMKKQADELKKKLESMTLTSQSNDGQVKLTINGNQDVLDIEIGDSLLSVAQKSSLIEKLKEAFTDSKKKVQEEVLKSLS